MKKNVWIIFFFILLFADLISIYSGNEILKTVFKPALMPVLILYFFSETKKIISRLKIWIALALIFSWFGDILLMLEEKGSIFFLLGLSSFLIAQIFYIVFFHNIRMKEYIRGNVLLLLAVVLYYAILISILSPHLGSMKLPVRIYGVVISFMLMLAMHMMFSKNKKAGLLMMLGAIFFITSDSLLAFNKFYSSFAFSGIAIMLTYGLAQLLITSGAVKYIKE
jgi:uncharacterized membrane protein YhhN